MNNIDTARKYRDKRYKAQETVNWINGLPNRIANRLVGLNFDNMTPAEKQIADLLGHEGFLFFDENGVCMEI